MLAHENTAEKLDRLEAFFSSRCGFSLLSLSLTSHSCSSVELTDDKEYQARLICARGKCVLRQDDTFECMMWLPRGGSREAKCFAFASNPVYVGWWWKIGPGSFGVKWLCVGVLSYSWVWTNRAAFAGRPWISGMWCPNVVLCSSDRVPFGKEGEQIWERQVGWGQSECF